MNAGHIRVSKLEPIGRRVSDERRLGWKAVIAECVPRSERTTCRKWAVDRCIVAVRLGREVEILFVHSNRKNAGKRELATN